MKKNPPPTLTTQNLKEKKSRDFECMLQPTHWSHVFLVFKTVGHHIWPQLMAGAEIEQGRKTKNKSARTHECCSFFLFEGERGEGFFFPCRSQCVPIMSPNGFPVVNVLASSSQTVPRCAPEDVPNSTWVLSCMVCPKFNSHGYKLKRLYLGEHTCFYVATQDPKRCFYWGHAQCSYKIADGPMNMAPIKIKKRLGAQPWSN